MSGAVGGFTWRRGCWSVGHRALVGDAGVDRERLASRQRGHVAAPRLVASSRRVDADGARGRRREVVRAVDAGSAACGLGDGRHQDSAHRLPLDACHARLVPATIDGGKRVLRVARAAGGTAGVARVVEQRANVMHKQRVQILGDLFPVGKLESPLVRDPAMGKIATENFAFRRTTRPSNAWGQS